MKREPSFYNPAASNGIGLIEVVFWALPVAAYFVFPDNLSFGAQILIMSLYAMSLGLILGFAGIVTLGHAAFFGIGAYSTALISLAGYHEPITATLAGGLLAAVLACAVGPIVLRLSGLSLMMMTLAIGAVLFEAANKFSWLTGGENGLSGIEFDPILGMFRWSVFGQTSYVYCLAWLFVMFLLFRSLVGSPFGLALQGVRENALRMRLVGAPVSRHLIKVYAVSAFMAGVAGGLSAQVTGFVGLDVLAIDLSINGIIMLVLGGVGSIYGGPVGAAVYMILKDFAANWDPYNWMAVIGLFLIFVVLFGKNGLIGLGQRALPKSLFVSLPRLEKVESRRQTT
ncbi:branched-chain amino acid ABC transporter permease [Rhizobium bangladeshense]|uniref:Branched-chain amino acid ABC transporter permease n=1 Tax=Rhizobium bangladeshense TaxID=1138189 RepID=A0ABS7LLS7_9HYPH|nr:branched-chain amino acid ABC transporter permease [Rhizobium bangladeshense]MBY3592365.1 branched-chain amino acid ABC transporter permease [Rhizobium bangladeshense]